MPTYTVHAPPTASGSNPDPQRFAFVRDGFHFWAFVTGPLWLLAHRLWLALAGYVGVVVLMSVLLYLFVQSEPARFVIGLLLALLIGFEAGTLRRWTYARRGWRLLGMVVGDDEESAERRFFAQWIERAPAPTQRQSPVQTPPPRPQAPAIIGLFPEPGARPGSQP